MKKLLSIFVFVFALNVLNAQTTFRVSYDIASFDLSGGMVQNPAGDFVMAGTNATFLPLYGNAMKLDASGNVVWAKAYTGGIATDIWDIKNVSTGGYIMCGSSSGSGAILIRIDDNGNLIWANRYTLPNRPADDASNEYANAVIETSDGGFLVGGGVDYFWDGVSANTVDTTSALGFKVNSGGTLQWSKVWTIATTNPDEHYINDVAESADGYFFVGESSEGSGTLNSDGDYPRNALLIKTDFSGNLTYIRRWGAGNSSSQGINCAIRINTGNILLGGYDDIHSFLITVAGTGSTPTMGAFNRRINGASFPPRTVVIQDIMQGSDNNFSIIGMQIEPLSFAFYSALYKINSSTGALIFGKGYSPIGLSSILPEGGQAADQGYFMTMTDQQAGGFNYNIIRTDASGNMNDPDAGCTPVNLSPSTTGYSVTLSTPTSANFNLASGNTFTPTVTNITPARGEHCLNVVCTPPAAPTASASPTTICNGQSSTITATAPSGVTFYYYTTSTGGTAFASGNSTVVSPTTTTTYYVESDDNSNPGCKSTRTAVTVTVVQPPNAGTNGTTTVCSNGSAVNLFTLLGGSPSTGGTWSGPSALTGGSNGTFTPGTNTAGTYTYSVAAISPCSGPATATVTVTVNTAPNAGTSASTTVCSNSSAFNLFSLLTGSPQTGGTWSGPSALTGGSNGTFTPGSNTAGTYTYTVNGSAPCALTSTSTVTVSVTNAPNAGTTTTASFCSNGSPTNLLSLLGGSAQTGGTWSGPSALTGGSNGTFTPGTNIAGTYTYTVTGVSPCSGTSTATVTVTITGAPNSGTSASTTVCSNGSAINLISILTGAPQGGGTWTGPSTLTGGSAGTYTPGTNVGGVYTYTVTGVSPCSGTVSSTVTVNEVAYPDPGTSTTITLCSDGSPVNLITQLGGSPQTTGSWSGPSTLAGGSNGTFDPATNTAGTYTYSITATSPCTGTQSATVTVIVSTAPNSGTSASTTLCSNGSSVDLYSILGGSPSTNGTWSGPSTLTGGSLGTFNPTTNSSGVYTYTVNGTAPCAANSTSTVTVTVNSAPNAGTSNTLAVCANDPAVDLLTLLGGSASTSGTWTGPSALTGGSNGTFTPGSNTAGTYTYTVTGTAPCSNAQTTVVVTVNSLPTAPTASASSTTICDGQSTTITASGIGATTFNIYDAATGGNFLGTAPLSVSPSTTTTYYVEAVNSNGCSHNGALVAITITVLPIDDPSWTTPGATCEQAGSINLDALITGTTGGTWSGTGVTGNSFDPTGLAGQTISITYTVGTSPCEQTSTQTIAVQALITGTWTNPGTMCESDGILNLNTLITGTAGGTWSGTGVSGNTFDPTGLSGSVSITYTVGVNPCIDIVTQSITINASPLDPIVTTTSDTVCMGDSITITASGSGAGVTYNIYDAATGGTLVGTTPFTFTPSSSGSYYVEATNSNGCINLGGRDEVAYVVNANPVADAGANTSVCPNESTTITATGGGSYLWSTTETTASILVSPTTITTYYVTVTNTAGCTDMDSVVVDIYSGAGSLAAVDDSTTTESGIAVTTDVVLNDAGNISSVSILSGPANGTASVNGTEITYTSNSDYIGNDTITYVTCDAFCSSYCDTAILVIRVTEEIVIEVPSGFSPNNDGLNDVWEIVGLYKYPENELWIYNRWGELVFHAQPYENDWHGQSNNDKLKLTGDEVTDGTYFYVLKLTPDDEGMNGYIELRRR